MAFQPQSNHYFIDTIWLDWTAQDDHSLYLDVEALAFFVARSVDGKVWTLTDYLVEYPQHRAEVRSALVKRLG